MKILIVSTLHHNPGDDFIRWGAQHLLRRAGLAGDTYLVHKHDPRTLFPSFRQERTPHRLIAPLLYSWYAARHSGNLLDSADLVVFAGTPFVWKQQTRLLRSTAANAEWVGPTWRRLFSDVNDAVVLNLAAGTSLNPGQDVNTITDDQRLAAFLDAAVRRTGLTTARDVITGRILNSLGHSVPVLACTSLWAAVGAGLRPQDPEYVAVNVMPRGVHPSRGKRTVAAEWRDTIRRVVDWLLSRHRVRIVCHSPAELATARAWFPTLEATYDPDARQVLAAYGRALYTIANRVHGAAGCASFGRPALGIGGDTRIDLLREFGLPVLSTGTATHRTIIEQCEEIELKYSEMTSQLSKRSADQEREYLGRIAEVFHPGRHTSSHSM